MKDFEEQECIPFEPRKYLMNAIMNNITIFLIGKTFTKEDAVFKEFLDIELLGMELFSGTGKQTLIDVFPWLGFFGNETPKLMNFLKACVHELFETFKRRLRVKGIGELYQF